MEKHCHIGMHRCSETVKKIASISAHTQGTIAEKIKIEPVKVLIIIKKLEFTGNQISRLSLTYS